MTNIAAHISTFDLTQSQFTCQPVPHGDMALQYAAGDLENAAVSP